MLPPDEAYQSGQSCFQPKNCSLANRGVRRTARRSIHLVGPALALISRWENGIHSVHFPAPDTANGMNSVLRPNPPVTRMPGYFTKMVEFATLM